MAVFTLKMHALKENLGVARRSITSHKSEIVLFLLLTGIMALSLLMLSVPLLIIMIVTVLIVPGWIILQLPKEATSLCLLERVSIAIMVSSMTLLGIYVFVVFLNGDTNTLHILLGTSLITLFSLLTKVVYLQRIETKLPAIRGKSRPERLTIILVLSVTLLVLFHRSFEVFRPQYTGFFVGYDTPFYARIIDTYRYGVPIMDEFLVGGLILTDPPAYYIILSTLTSIAQDFTTITAMAVVISALTTIPLFLLYRLVSCSTLTALLGAILYQFSWFSLRFFNDLHKATLANFFLFLGFYLTVRGLLEKDSFRTALGGLSIGLTMIIHGQLILPTIGCILLYLTITSILGRRFAPKHILVLFACIFTILLPSEVFLWVSGGQPWMKTIALLIGSQTLRMTGASSSETLALAQHNVAPIQTLLITDLVPLLFGGALVILKGKKEAVWFIVLAISTLVGSQLYILGILASQAFFLWLYYGAMISLLKAAFILAPLNLTGKLKCFGLE